MSAPEIPIDVDPETGVWTTDGLPMIYVPRHFLVNGHREMEAALGIEEHRRLVTRSGDRSAFHWCKTESRYHGLDATATFNHYLQRLSQRGWGRFSVESLDAASGARIALRHSVFPLEYGQAGRPVCYLFEGFIIGAFRYVLAARNLSATLRCDEVQCVADGAHDCCRFELTCDNVTAMEAGQ